MCGIAGIIANCEFDLIATLDAMLARQSHRGPDNTGTALYGNTALGHNRLSIIDLNPRSNQPMEYKNGKLSITYNGEIYNFKELRAVLQAKGHDFNTDSDTEVVLAAYLEYGEELVQHLDGMFAFAILDQEKQTLFLARDRFGKKPLVYYESDELFAFASEIPAILEINKVPRYINQSALAGMLLHNFRHIVEPHSAFTAIKRLRPGHSMLVNKGKICWIKRYFDPSSEFKRQNTPLKQMVEESVMKRLVADVKVGVLLSGGVDSTAITAIMCKNSSEAVHSYALGYDEKDEDLRRAREAAKLLGTVHKEFYFQADRQWEIFQKIIETYGDPIMLLPLIHAYEISETVRKDGIHVILGGHGADECFYGYTGHINTAFYTSVYSNLKPILNALGRFSILPQKLRVFMQEPGMRKSFLYRGSEEVWKSVCSEDAIREFKNLPANELEYWGKTWPTKHYIDESNFLSLITENAHSVTISSDLPAMMASVEMRAPFLDSRLVGQAFSIDYNEKVGSFYNTRLLKLCLKKALETYVPRRLLYAPKRGFGFGIQEKDLLNNQWRNFADEYLNNAHTCQGMFDPEKIRSLWNRHKTSPDQVQSNIVARLLSIMVWARRFL